MFSLDQYQAIRRAAGVIDRSFQGKIELRGNDRASFLHALLTNDVLALKAGTGCYAAYLTPQGRMIADMRVIEVGDRLLLDVSPAVASALSARLDQLIFSEDVRVTDATGMLGEIGVHGPESANIIHLSAGIETERLTALTQYENVQAGFGEAQIVIVRDDLLGEMGFDIYLDRAGTAELQTTLQKNGGVVCSAETADVLRIENGRPLFGADMTTATIPLEAGIEDRAISFTKGCYVGQEVIIRVLHRGHGRIARKLVGLMLDGTDVPAPGDVILKEAEQVGEVTSSAMSPAVGGPVALGYVRRDAADEGSGLTVLHGGRSLAARIVRLPFRPREI